MNHPPRVSIEKLEHKLRVLELKLRNLEDSVLDMVIHVTDIKKDNHEIKKLSKSCSDLFSLNDIDAN